MFRSVAPVRIRIIGMRREGAASRPCNILLCLCLILGAVSTIQAGELAREGRVKVRASRSAVPRLLNRGGELVADYGAFAVIEVPAGALSDDIDAEVRPDENIVRLHAGPIDTTQPPARQLRRARGAFGGKALHLVQFAGPVRPAWMDELAATGARIVTYIPSNTYLIYGDAAQIGGVQALAGKSRHIQWDAAYADGYKIDPRGLLAAQGKGLAPGHGDLYAVQMVDDPPANQATLEVIDRLRSGPVRRSWRLLDYFNVVVHVPPGKLAQLARQPDVVSIQPYVPPRRFDERQDQIVAGNLSGSGPAAPGYLAWLASWGFTQAQFDASGFVVDVTDSGVDNGTSSPNHFGLYTEGIIPGTSRVVYNRLEGTPNAGSTIVGCDGHGTVNAHILAGYSDLTGFPFADSSGYRYGLGVAPFVRIGSSVIFDPAQFTYPNYASLQSKAYQDGARISSNSWGADNFGMYDVDAQAYDALVRDAQPDGSPFPAPGNQEMVIVFANGNAGSGLGTVGTPATSKNVISVGAAENVQAFGGADSCNVADSGADSTDDIIPFSSRGPTADGRFKPDIVAPGTHVTGGVVQIASPGATGTADPCFSGEGVCGGVYPSHFFPPDQQFYSASSGTSHSCPAVSGGAALLRQLFLNMGRPVPSPAMTKALLINSARHLTGTGANDTLWSNSQGMGALNLQEAFARLGATPTILRDQEAADLFTATGQQRLFTGTITDVSKPFRVTLAWTDAPGPTSSAAYRNDLDLVVTAGGSTYKGNVFGGAASIAGGVADARNNVESVFLPAGVNGSFVINVTAVNINSDGVPNFGGALDQDFALVIYNASQVPLPVIAAEGSTITAESCLPGSGALDPGETVTVNLSLQNVGSADTGDVVATLEATGGVALPSASQNYGPLVVGGGAVSRPYTFTASGQCGTSVKATLLVESGGNPLGSVFFNFVLGSLGTVFSENFDAPSPPALPAGWSVTTSGTPAPTPWATTSSVRDSLPNSAFASDPSTTTDNILESPSIPIGSPAAKLTFRHSFSLETSYDAGVLEISIGGAPFTDILTAGGGFVAGGYNRTISVCCGNPLSGRQGWSGNSEGFMTTTVNLPAAAAGQEIRLRWRLGTDYSISGTGWYVDTISISELTCCTCAPPCERAIVGWRSVREHEGAGPLGIPLDEAASGDGMSGPVVEPRQGGIQKIEVDFDQPPSLLDSAGVSVTGVLTVDGVAGPPEPYVPTTVMMADSDTLAILFSPGTLPDAGCYTITIGPGTFGETLTGDVDVMVRSLVGDTTMSGDITLSDVTLVQTKFASAAADGPQFDLDLSGTVNASDMQIAKSHVTSPPRQALCP